MKAMILAAGFGNRLMPLTNYLPKAVIPVLNRPLVTYPIETLKKSGINEIVINVHHLKNKIIDILGNGSRFGVSILYSRENEILGTGGGIKKVEEFLSSDDFVVFNSDVICNIDISIPAMIHKSRKAIATMVLRENPNENLFGSISIDKNNRITELLGKRIARSKERFMFTGVHILSPEVFNYLPDGRPSCIINDFYLKAFSQGKLLLGYKYTGCWADLGTHRRYLETSISMLRMSFLSDRKREFIDRSVKIDRDSKIIYPVLIGKNTKIKSGCVIGPNAIIGDSCVIKEDSHIANSILWDDITLPKNSIIENRIKNASDEINV